MAGRRGTGVVEALAFFLELTMLVSLAVAGAGLGGGRVAHILLAVALPVVAVAVWARWMAPSSEHRLADPGRYVAQVLLFALTAVALGFAGQVVWGVVFAVVASAVFAVTRLGDASPGRTSGRPGPADSRTASPGRTPGRPDQDCCPNRPPEGSP